MKIKYNLLTEGIIDLEIELNPLNGKEIYFPRFRPGKYMLGVYESNVMYLNIFQNGKQIEYTNNGKSSYTINTSDESAITIKASIKADKEIDGGNTCYNKNNIINLLPTISCYYQIGYNGNIDIEITTKKDIKLDTTLESISKKTTSSSDIYQFKAKNIDELFDSPIVGGVENINFFELQIKNDYKADIKMNFITNFNYNFDEIKNNLSKLVNSIIKEIGYLPVKKYSFHLFNVHGMSIHGVEHQNSTLIVMSSNKESYLMNSQILYDIFYSISSHEFFHVWNAKHVRPKELIQIDYQNENFFDTCAVTEGLTSLMDDYFCLKSGIFDQEKFKKFIIDFRFKRILDDEKKYLQGHKSNSLASYSIDLWKGGYNYLPLSGEINSYNKGAIVWYYLDFLLRKDYSVNIFDFVKLFLSDKAVVKNGYDFDDIKRIIAHITDQKFAAEFVDTYFLSQMTYDQILEIIKSLEFKIEGHTK